MSKKQQEFPLYRRNLWVCWFSIFVGGIGASQIAPILPLFIDSLGSYSESEVSSLTGIAFGATFLATALFTPIWGIAADRWGCKPMVLRASLGSALVVFTIGVAPNVETLITLRFIQGAVSGLSAACTILIATQVSKNNAGRALGMISTAQMSGALVGPLFGGLLTQSFGTRLPFLVIGAFMLLAFFLALFFIKEDFNRNARSQKEGFERLRDIPYKKLIGWLCITLALTSIVLFSTQPVLTMYAGSLWEDKNYVALLAGLMFSATGLANIIAAPLLGRLSDRLGAHNVLITSMLVAAVIVFLQGSVADVWQLLILRFLQGLALGGIIPAINTLIKLYTSENHIGRVFGISQALMFLGQSSGSIGGGLIAAGFGSAEVFSIMGVVALASSALAYLTIYRMIRRIRSCTSGS